MLERLRRSVIQDKFFIVLVIVGVVVFSNSLMNQFVWTDPMYIVPNTGVQANIFSVFYSSVSTQPGYYRPLTALYYFTINGLFGSNSFFYHLIQISIFITNACLLYFLYLHFFKKNVSGCLALIYLVHPVNEITAVFISAANGVLYMFFGLLSLTFYFKKFKNKLWQLSLICFLLLLSLLAKETAIFFLAFVILHQLIFRHTGKKIYYIIGMILVLITYLIIRLKFGGGFVASQNELYPFSDFTLLQRLSNLPQEFLFYIYHFIIPYDIGMIHLWKITSIDWESFYAPLLIDAIFLLPLLVFAILVYKKNKENFKKYLFFLLLFCISITFFLQIYTPLDYTVSARWFYFPMISLLGIFGVVLETYRFDKRDKLLLAITIVAIILFSVRTMVKNTFWRNDISLFTQASVVDDNFSIENLLAFAYYNKGNNLAALNHVAKSIAMFPYDNNLMTMAIVYERMGDMQNAVYYALRAYNADNYNINKHDENTYLVLGKLLLNNKNAIHAKRILTSGVAEYPNSMYLWILLAYSDFRLQDNTAAIYALDKARAIDQDHELVTLLYDSIETNAPLRLEFR